MKKTAVAAGVIALWMGCGEDVQTTNNQGSSSSSVNASSTSAASTGSGGGSGGGNVCGGIAGLECAMDEWCDFEPSTCIGGDEMGFCKPQPDACDFVIAPVCGCDGVVYDNECAAQQNGADINLNGGCTAPQGTFGCGAAFCNIQTQYCEVIGSDVGGEPNVYSCKPLPSPVCSSCDCLASEPCGETCMGGPQTGFTLTCPGG
jgi:hypothetical protein